MINVGICGYGNLGKACEKVLSLNVNLKLVAIFTKRDPKEIKTLTNVDVYNVSDVRLFTDKIDVMLMCGGSSKDLPIESVELNKHFNIIDSYDTHDLIFEHYQRLDQISNDYKKVSLVSTGWDPGMLSINRLYNETILLNPTTYTFWGRGISQGHSDAIRKIDGVKDAISYTIPVDKSMNKVKSNEELLDNELLHTRHCYVVIEENVDKEIVEEQIKQMPYYFKDYQTTVEFIKQETLNSSHKKLFHKGRVVSYNKIDEEYNTLSYDLKTDSNPIMTASIMISYVSSIYKLYLNEEYGCKTVFDIPLSLMSDKSKEELIRKYL